MGNLSENDQAFIFLMTDGGDIETESLAGPVEYIAGLRVLRDEIGGHARSL